MDRHSTHQQKQLVLVEYLKAIHAKIQIKDSILFLSWSFQWVDLSFSFSKTIFLIKCLKNKPTLYSLGGILLNPDKNNFSWKSICLP